MVDVCETEVPSPRTCLRWSYGGVCEGLRSSLPREIFAGWYYLLIRYAGRNASSSMNERDGFALGDHAKSFVAKDWGEPNQKMVGAWTWLISHWKSFIRISGCPELRRNDMMLVTIEANWTQLLIVREIFIGTYPRIVTVTMLEVLKKTTRKRSRSRVALK